MYFLFRLGYACCYNKQMIDNAFLEARGQSASCSGQLVTKIEASFRGGGGGGGRTNSLLARCCLFWVSSMIHTRII